VTDADGPFSVALYAPESKGCVVLSEKVSDTHYAFAGVELGGGRARDEGGVFGGPMGSPVPTTVHPTLGAHHFTATKLGLLQGEGLGAAVVGYAWDGPGKTVYFSGSSVLGVSAHDDLFFFTATAGSPAIKLYSSDAGLREFMGFGADRTRGAADLATDGKVWVWQEGSGRTSSSTPFESVSWMVAPFVRDPAQLTPRVLRTGLLGYGFALANMQVGCGRAAKYGVFKLGDGGFSTGIQIVDVATGDGWFLPSNPSEFSIIRPIALTCDEVFIDGYEYSKALGRGVNNIYRIRLDSLSGYVWPKP